MLIVFENVRETMFSNWKTQLRGFRAWTRHPQNARNAFFQLENMTFRCFLQTRKIQNSAKLRFPVRKLMNLRIFTKWHRSDSPSNARNITIAAPDWLFVNIPRIAKSWFSRNATICTPFQRNRIFGGTRNRSNAFRLTTVGPDWLFVSFTKNQSGPTMVCRNAFPRFRVPPKIYFFETECI